MVAYDLDVDDEVVDTYKDSPPMHYPAEGVLAVGAAVGMDNLQRQESVGNAGELDDEGMVAVDAETTSLDCTDHSATAMAVPVAD